MPFRNGVDSIGVRFQREGIKCSLDIVAFTSVEEHFIRGAECGERRGDRGDPKTLDVFLVDELEADFAGGLRDGVVGWGGAGDPDGVGFAVAYLAEEVDEVGGEGDGVEGEGADFGDVCAEGTVEAGAF